MLRHAVICATLVGAVATAGHGAARAQDPSPAPEQNRGFILGPEDGDRVLNHLIKVDPVRGSDRLGMGRQHLRAARSIALHIHGGEDELLYVVSGRAIGVVGNVEREVVAGSVIYVPQGAWHGLKAIEPTEILWIVSPPNFARFLREAQAAGSGLPESRREEIARKHQQSDSRDFLRLALAESEWLADKRWGRVVFGADGRTATYRTTSGRTGVLEIRDERKEDLGFIGLWRGDDGSQGEFVLSYEFAGGSTLTIDSGQGNDARSILRRIR